MTEDQEIGARKNIADQTCAAFQRRDRVDHAGKTAGRDEGEQEVKNASGLYNLMRNLGGAIGLADANTLMIQLNKEHYAVLRESVTPGSPQAQSLLAGLQERMAGLSLPDSELAALKQLNSLVMREAEV